jgi:hypothetical protein
LQRLQEGLRQFAPRVPSAVDAGCVGSRCLTRRHSGHGPDAASSARRDISNKGGFSGSHPALARLAEYSRPNSPLRLPGLKVGRAPGTPASEGRRRLSLRCTMSA